MHRAELPADEMYMSGRSLLPLSLQVAQKLSHDFDGQLPISFSGGSTPSMSPTCSARASSRSPWRRRSQPGGVIRFNQLAANAAEVMTDYAGIDVAKLDAPSSRGLRGRAVPQALPREDPLPQDRLAAAADRLLGALRARRLPHRAADPGYLTLTATAGRYGEAFDVIATDNTAPTITGVLCCSSVGSTAPDSTTTCPSTCAGQAVAPTTPRTTTPPRSPRRRCGPRRGSPSSRAGPAGIAAGLYLRRNGMEVDVFEKLSGPYGIVKYIIPHFRIEREQIERDYEMAVAMGVQFHFNADPNYDLGCC